MRINFLIFVSITLSACSFAPQKSISQPVNNATMTKPPVFLHVSKNATSTPTPFLPLQSTTTYIPDTPTTIQTETPLPTETPTITPVPWGDYPGPSVNPSLPIDPPVGLFQLPAGQVNILLLGSDQRINQGGFRTDTIMLLSLNPNAGTATVTSVPRDLYVYIPGWTIQRINTAMVFGSFNSLALTFEYNFGVRPDYYLLINFSGFVTIIDDLDGIDVNVATELVDHRDKYGTYTMPAGMHHMDSETALWYVRSRYSTSDFDRGRRQQEVLQAIASRLLSLDGVSRAPALYEQYRQNVNTNLTISTITSLIPLAAKLKDLNRVQRYAISGNQVTSWVNPTNGAQVLLPNRVEILKTIRLALGIP